MIELSAFCKEDMELFRSWLYAPHVRRWYTDPEDWLYEVENKEGAFNWIHHFIAECGGRPIGFCQYYEYCRSGEDWHGSIDAAGAYSIDYLIGETGYLRRGLGKEIVSALLERIRLHENAKRVIVQPDADNQASRALLLSCGFLFDKENRLFFREL